MDLFHVETGVVAGSSCHEEATPMLPKHKNSNVEAEPSKPFLIHNSSVTSVNDITLSFHEKIASGFHKVDTNNNCREVTDSIAPRGSPEYCTLSPSNLGLPLVATTWPSTNQILSGKCNAYEREWLLQPEDAACNLVCEENPSYSIFKSLTAVALQESRLLSTLACAPNQGASTSWAPAGLQPISLYHTDGQRKTLEELAREWNNSKELENKTDTSPVTEKSPVSQTSPPPSCKQDMEICEEDGLLVRHTYYYTTSPGGKGMTSRECRLRNKLKARLRAYNDNAYTGNYGPQNYLINLVQN